MNCLCPLQPCLQKLRGAKLTERHARALLRLDTEPAQLAALEYIISQGLNVAQTDSYIDALLSPAQPKAQKRKPTYIIKDVRLFLNTISRGMDLMRSAGVDARCLREESEGEICLTIRIPKSVK